MKIKLIFSSLLAYTTLLALSTSAEPVEDKRALLDFIGNVSHSRSLNWDENSPVCNNWTGVACSDDGSRIVAVRLPAFGLKGSVPTDAIGRLSELRVLSLRSNALAGPFPYDLLRIKSLTGVYLQDNDFQGSLPADLSVWTNLSVLVLSNNRFNGSIPSSILRLSSLQALNLANNSFSGEIPDLDLPGLSSLDLSNNNLTGRVPSSLLRFPRSSFFGNNVSFDRPPGNNLGRRSGISEPAILGIVVGTCALSFLAIAALLILMNKVEKHHVPSVERSGDYKSSRSDNRKKTDDEPRPDPNSKLGFFEGCDAAFDLEDLLRASAEVLGKGTFGTTYKAALEDSNALFAVKRLTKTVAVGRTEFENHMEVVGNIRHENIVPLRAYYYSKDEKLLIYDYCDGGSLSSLLHGGTKKSALSWERRVSIAIKAAKGVAHIHSHGKKLAHGSVKASNVLVDSQMRVQVSDFGLQAIMPATNQRKAAARAADVYGFGVLILELLTGKSPAAGGSKEGFSLVRWVQSVVREEWTGEVFDADLLKGRRVEEDMVEMLRLGLSCVVKAAEQRPEMGEVLKVLEAVGGNGDGGSDGIRSLDSSPTLA